jgi:NAD(P)-dependent dehydrogenase (short-subunit alcohol dehydrogenase family)
MSSLAKTAQSALVIGSSGGIAKALVSALLDDHSFDFIHTVSRSKEGLNDVRVKHYQVNSVNESEVEACCKVLQQEGVFLLIVCCIGTLHGGDDDKNFRPEKRLESLNSEAMLRYFQTNALAPMNWLKHITNLVPKNQTNRVVFFTARVASIEDNYLGGWYGYRASKAALNMLIKTAQIELFRRSPNTVLVSYHPGTVDTGLSRPFQKNVPDGKLFTPEFTVAQLLKILPSLTEENAPHYIDWQGKTIPW